MRVVLDPNVLVSALIFSRRTSARDPQRLDTGTYLISGDRHLTGLTDPNPPVLTPRQFRDVLTETPD